MSSVPLSVDCPGSVFEAHSTDYQPAESLAGLVRTASPS